MEQKFKYFAFISYSSKDTKWGRKVQKKLEHYRMPTMLCSEHGWNRTPMKPVFFAPTDIQPGGLTEELQSRLKDSRNLIVICSPDSAQSKWVGMEIEFFYKLGRAKQIHFFIVRGGAHSGNPNTECFNPVVDALGIPEILGANIHERIYRWHWLNKERAYIQLISKLLGVEFDAIWQRHKRMLVQKIIVWSIGVSVLLSVWTYTIHSNIPFTAEISVKDISQNLSLPKFHNGVAVLYIEDERLIDSVNSQTGKAVFTRIPRRYLNQDVRVAFSAQDYRDLDTIISLSKYVDLAIERNAEIYGHIKFVLWSSSGETFVPNCEMTISDGLGNVYPIITDSCGRVDMLIPLEKQQISYTVSSSVSLETNIIYMPCGRDDVILTK